MKIIDLSTVIEANNRSLVDRTEIVYQSHAEGATQIEGLLKVPANLLRDGEGWSTEVLTYFHTHSTTHVDAPWHYQSKIQGEPAQTIDELPLEWFFSDGVVLDMSHKADHEVVTVSDLEQALSQLGYSLKPLDIVCIRTDCDRYLGRPDYMMHGCGVSAEATRWLYEQGIRVMGIDAWGWDAPLHLQAATALTQQKTGIFWAAHQVDLSYAQIERLTNLAALPPFGFKVACFPLKIKGGSAGPARVVAILEN